MARPKAQLPTLRFHISGQSAVRIDGQDFYLGKHGSPEPLARYAVLIAEYQRGGLSPGRVRPKNPGAKRSAFQERFAGGLAAYWPPAL